MKIHSITEKSFVNGPGCRFVIHFQGCKFQCPGCFNPQTHGLDGGTEMSIEDVLKKIPADVDGVTISGGEPFLQVKALLSFVKAIRETKNLPIVVFSGFYIDEIKSMKYGNEVFGFIDVLIDGRFDETKMSTDNLHGSDNQTIHLLSSLYKQSDFEKREVEFTFDLMGHTKITGFPSVELLQEVK